MSVADSFQFRSAMAKSFEDSFCRLRVREGEDEDEDFEEFARKLFHSGSEVRRIVLTGSRRNGSHSQRPVQLSEIRYGRGGKGCKVVMEWPFAFFQQLVATGDLQ